MTFRIEEINSRRNPMTAPKTLVALRDGKSFGSAAWLANMQAYVVRNRDTGTEVEAANIDDARAIMETWA